MPIVLLPQPSGIRSAVPLGGLSAGSVELRGDGSLHEWIIHNAGCVGALVVTITITRMIMMIMMMRMITMIMIIMMTMM